MTATVTSPRQRDAVEAPERSTAAARFRGRWRVALRYGGRDARRNKGRTILVAIMVLLPVAVGSLAATVLWSERPTPERAIASEIGPGLQAVARYVGDTAIQQQPDGNGWGTSEAGTAPRTPAQVDAAVRAAMPDDAAVVGGLTTYLQVRSDRTIVPGTAVQADVTSDAVAATFPLVQGALPASGEVAVARSLADDLGVHVGDRLTLRLFAAPAATSRALGTARVSGIFDSAPPVYELLIPGDGPLHLGETIDINGISAVTPTWLIGGKAPVTWDDVMRANAAGVVVTSRAVLLDPPDDADVPGLGGDARESMDDVLRVYGVTGAVILVGLLEAVLLIGPSFAVGTRRSSRSLALVAANGGTKRSVRAVVLGSSVVIGAIGSLVGVTLGIAGAAFFVRAYDAGLTFFSVPWLAIAGVAAVGVLLAVAGAWIPARGASKADVVAVLAGRRGEASARRWPAVVGTVLAVAGYAAAIAGGVWSHIVLLLAGVLTGQVGMVLACGGIVAALGRVAGHLSLSWRLALRDAARHRGRTSPAIAAVLVATAGATAGLCYSAAQALHDYRSMGVVVAPGVLEVADLREGTTGLSADDLAQVDKLVHDVAPQVGDLLPVTALAEQTDGETATGFVVRRPQEDFGGGYSGMAIPGPIVDDGTLVDLLGIAEPDAARSALAAGRAVAQRGTLFGDGTLHYGIESWNRTDGSDNSVIREGTLPATAVGDARGPGNANYPLLPPALVAQVGLPTMTAGVVSAEPTTLTNAQVSTLSARLEDRFGSADWGGPAVDVSVGETPTHLGSPDWLATLLILGAGVLLALAAAWIAAALAATESRPDLATLTAVGSPPSTRKRVVAAQAGTIAVIGTVVGVASGLALGAAFVLNERHRYAGADLTWEFTVPWLPIVALLVGLPLLAVGSAWLVTRGRLTLTRRLAG